MIVRRSFLKRTFAGALTAAGLAFGVPMPRWTWEEESATWGIDYWIVGRVPTKGLSNIPTDGPHEVMTGLCGGGSSQKLFSGKVRDPYDWSVTE